MKYRHGFHAGNFADVHKHVTLLALLAALQKKDKGFLYLDTHAGSGSYDLSATMAEPAAGIGRFDACTHEVPELGDYARLLEAYRQRPGQRHRYPGSPLVASLVLRPQDRSVFIELQGAEAHALGESLRAVAPAHATFPAHTAPEARTARADTTLPAGRSAPGVHIERGDGFERLRAFLPPAERRGLVFIDPPYETREDSARVGAALAEGLKRFATGVFAAWYPIKEERASSAWLAACARTLDAPALVSELWLYPRDSRVALNGSGLLIANPPWRIAERMRVWLPALEACLRAGPGSGSAVRMLSQSPA